jgi:hypothetical protein
MAARARISFSAGGASYRLDGLRRDDDTVALDIGLRGQGDAQEQVIGGLLVATADLRLLRAALDRVLTELEPSSPEAYSVAAIRQCHRPPMPLDARRREAAAARVRRGPHRGGAGRAAGPPAWRHPLAAATPRRQVGSDHGGHDAVRRLQLLADLAQLALAARHQHQIVAVAGEQWGQLQPNATRGAGDKCRVLHSLLVFSGLPV